MSPIYTMHFIRPLARPVALRVTALRVTALCATVLWATAPLALGGTASARLGKQETARPQNAPRNERNDLIAATQAGSPINLSQVRGWKVVYFWSSSCPCVASCQRVSITPLARKYRNKVRFFAIASNAANLAYEKETGQGAQSGAEQGHQQERITLALADVAEQAPPPGCPLLLDPHHRLADRLKATHTPQAFLLSPDNRVVFRGDPDNSVEVRARTGKEGVTRRYLADALRQALAGKKITRPVITAALGCAIDRSDAPTPGK